jgi:hypothetical protein
MINPPLGRDTLFLVTIRGGISRWGKRARQQQLHAASLRRYLIRIPKHRAKRPAQADHTCTRLLLADRQVPERRSITPVFERLSRFGSRITVIVVLGPVSVVELMQCERRVQRVIKPLNIHRLID